MSVQSGSRLGPYEILSRLGAGGMGEVWKANDTRLDRSVAVKILPAEFAADAQLRARFEREAKTISQLEHPHICRLYDVGETSSGEGAGAPLSYLVMELLEGETLADRLMRGALPLLDVLKFGTQVADALDKAHRQGVVHRDLKPGNVMLTKSGAKLLDFGLAKSGVLIGAPAHSPSLDEGATQQKPLTEQGTILGTFQYMAPEQLEGQDADARTDIFAFGALLYEMLTGKRAFEGKTRTSLIAAIVDRQPPPASSIQPLTPPALEHVISKCLEKDPDSRWQSAGDIAEELRWISGNLSAAVAGTAVTRHKRMRERHIWIAVTLILALSTGTLLWLRQRDAAATFRNRRLAIPLHPGETFPPTSRHIVAVSSDGKTVAYTAMKEGRWPLYLRRLDQSAPVEVAEANGGYDPFFSPDGKWLAFFRLSRLFKVAVSGGVPVALTPVGNARGGTWAPDGYLYFTRAPSTGISRVPSSGGKEEEITRPDIGAGENSHRWPQVLPDGKSLLITVRTDNIATFDDARIAVLSLETRKWKTVLEGGSFGRYLPTGHLVYQRRGSLYATRFNLDKLEVEGTPFLILEGIRSDRSSGAAQFSVSNRGLLVFIPGTGSDEDGALLWLRQGAISPVTSLRRHFNAFAISPDERKIAAVIGAANDDVWLLDTERESLTRFSFEPGDEYDPVWMPDGQRILYKASLPGRGRRLLIQRADGTGAPEELARSEEGMGPVAVSPDGKLVAYSISSPQSNHDLWILPLAGERKPRVFLQTPYWEGQPRFSPDGRWLAYISDESGAPQVYVQGVAGGERWQVSMDFGYWPVWSPDGNRLYYLSRRDALYAVDVRTHPTFSAGKPRLVDDKTPFDCDMFAIARDGSILTCGPVPGERIPVAHLNVAFDWFDELKRKMEEKRP